MRAFLVTALLLGGCAGSVGNAPKLLRSAIDDKQDDLDKCYAKNLKSDAPGKGNMEVTLHVAADGGKVETVKVTNSDVDDKKLDKCVKTALESVAIDPAPSSDFDIDYTLQFGDAPPAKKGDDDGDDGGKPKAKAKVKVKKTDDDGGDDSDSDKKPAPKKADKKDDGGDSGGDDDN